MQEVLETIVAGLWETMFPGLPGHPNPEPPPTDAEVVVAQIDFAGDWEGRLRLACSEALGKVLAARIFYMASPAEVSEDDLTDLLGELANIAGGNLGSVLPGQSQLSLPNTSRGALGADSDFAERWLAGYVCEEGPLWIELCGRAESVAS